MVLLLVLDPDVSHLTVENQQTDSKDHLVTPSPQRIEKELVLIGGGHAHVGVLMNFGMKPMPGVRVTVISRDLDAPYSGMLPGLIAGHYEFDQAHLDVRKLAGFAGAQFVHGSVTGIDLERKVVHCSGRPPIRFDFVSINTGSTPEMDAVPGAREYATPVKPVDRFLERWEEILERIPPEDACPLRTVTVGGGAGGVELTLAAQFRFRRVAGKVASLALEDAHDSVSEGRARRSAGASEPGAQAKSKAPESLAREAGLSMSDPFEWNLEMHLVSDAETILPTHNRSVQRRYSRLLERRGIRVHPGQRVVSVRESEVELSGGQTLPYDILFWTTNAAAPLWPKAAGLATDRRGFIAVNDCLQSESHPFVFAAGDVAAVTNHPRPKAGVFAVRQGMPLATNLRLACADRPLIPFHPQKSFLSLISTGDQYAVASKGPFALEGRWVWRWKNWIDRRWMRKYQDLPEMKVPPAAVEEDAVSASSGGVRSPFMPCGGCGSKVGATVLSRVLSRLDPVRRDDILVGLDSPDDAAVVRTSPGKVAVHTVDSFRSFLSDPFLFGKIAANHALSDIFAMGAEAQSALAVVVVPYGSEAAVEESLFQVLSGAVEVLNECGCALAGGHSSEGAELSFGLSVQGVAEEERLLRKGGARPEDRLILTKGLGVGTLFAADMRREARGSWIQAAIDSMLQSNRSAAEILRQHGATACTDVTGFGLIGHLVEVLKASGNSAEVELEQVPLLSGAEEMMGKGIRSSLHPDNFRSRRAVVNHEEATKRNTYPILFDPQTSGGLLGAVPEAGLDSCLKALRESGAGVATVIGKVVASEGEESMIAVI